MRSLGLTYPVIADPGLAIVRRYGVRQDIRDIAVTSVFIADRSGTVRFVRVGRSPVDRPAVNEMIEVLRSMP